MPADGYGLPDEGPPPPPPDDGYGAVTQRAFESTTRAGQGQGGYPRLALSAASFPWSRVDEGGNVVEAGCADPGPMAERPGGVPGRLCAVGRDGAPAHAPHPLRRHLQARQARSHPTQSSNGAKEASFGSVAAASFSRSAAASSAKRRWAPSPPSSPAGRLALASGGGRA